MKKALIGIAAVLILAIVIVLFVNAREGDKVAKKPATEMKSDCGNCPMATPAACPKHSAAAMETAKPCCPDASKTGTATK